MIDDEKKKTKEEIITFLNYITDIMPKNTCTMAKLNRHPVTELRDNNKKCQNYTHGHSIIFSKDNSGNLLTYKFVLCSVNLLI